MAGYHNPYVKIASETNYQTTKNGNGMCTFSVLETKRKYNKEKEEWEIIDSWFWNAVVWGDKALEAATLSKGDVLDLSAEIKEGDNGQYVSHRAHIEQWNSEDENGKKRSKPQLSINKWEKREFDN